MNAPDMAAAIAAPGPAGSADAPDTLLAAQTAGSLLRHNLSMLRRHFGVLQLCGVLPVLPAMLALLLLGDEHPALLLLVWPVYMIAFTIASAALTVAVSDICLGNRPTVRHCFARAVARGRWWSLALTSALFALAFMCGLVLFLLPGLWLLMHGLLLSTVATLEGRRNLDAIKRSIALTRGQAWRIAGLFSLVLVLAYVAMLLLVVLVIFLCSLLLLLLQVDAKTVEIAMAAMGGVVAFGLVTPVFGTTLVLLYYDQRVRREAYDAHALSEDLMR